MSEILIATEIDALTGESIERELTLQEIEEINQLQKQSKSLKAEAKAKAEARQSALAKLAALGLTEAEIASL